MSAKYPHLLPADIPVWERFLTDKGPLYLKIDYDVRVGEGYDPGQDFGEPWRSDAVALSQRRIDAVGFLPDRIDVIELTTSAGLTAIGQLTLYPTLYKKTYKPSLPVVPLLVAATLQNDVLPALHDKEIPFLLYP